MQTYIFFRAAKDVKLHGLKIMVPHARKQVIIQAMF